MSIEDARKQAFFAAIGAVAFGAMAIIAVITIYGLYGSGLDSSSQQQGNAFLVKALKLTLFRLVPLLSFVLIVVGGCTLFYLRKESQPASRQGV